MDALLWFVGACGFVIAFAIGFWMGHINVSQSPLRTGPQSQMSSSAVQYACQLRARDRDKSRRSLPLLDYMVLVHAEDAYWESAYNGDNGAQRSVSNE